MTTAVHDYRGTWLQMQFRLAVMLQTRRQPKKPKLVNAFFFFIARLLVSRQCCSLLAQCTIGHGDDVEQCRPWLDVGGNGKAESYLIGCTHSHAAGWWLDEWDVAQAAMRFAVALLANGKGRLPCAIAGQLGSKAGELHRLGR